MNLKEYLRSGKGASDMMPLLGNAEAYGELVMRLTEAAKELGAEKVACVEGRGFLLGAPVALGLKLGLVPIRTSGKLKNEVYSQKFVDYSGSEKKLEVHKDAIQPGEKVVLVDDWVETGATVEAAITLVERCGGVVVGVLAFMDDSGDRVKAELSRYRYRFLERVSDEDTF